jgi:hypothetical protein
LLSAEGSGVIGAVVVATDFFFILVRNLCGSLWRNRDVRGDVSPGLAQTAVVVAISAGVNSALLGCQARVEDAVSLFKQKLAFCFPNITKVDISARLKTLNVFSSFRSFPEVEDHLILAVVLVFFSIYRGIR